ncbi:hypothetical protein R1sor_022807 [Riccia sorocarpa]|uniref:Uncharacterized protein n=1 Tax=Riccia sorocarpa TaxID=122646 RepID=A0ABD3GMG8_9MARC
MAASANCDVSGLSFKAFVIGAEKFEACSLPAVAAVVHATFGLLLLIRITLDGRNSDSITQTPHKITSSLHWLFTQLSGALSLVLLLAVIIPIWLWRERHYQSFPLDEVVIILLLALGWFVTFLALNQEEIRGRALHEKYLKRWHVIALLVSLPGALYSFRISIHLLIVVVPCLMLLALASGYFTGMIHAKNYNWGKTPTEPSLKQPLLDEFHDEPSPDLSGFSKASVFSRLVFWWMGGVLTLGNRRPLQFEDFPPMSAEDDAAYNYQEFSVHWENEKRRTSSAPFPSLWAAVIQTYRRDFLVIMSFGVVWSISLLVGPLMMYFMLRYLGESVEERVLWKGAVLVVTMFVGKCLECMAKNQLFFLSIKLGLRMWSGVGSAVYDKSLRLSSKSRQDWSVGEITNIISTDLQKFLQLNMALVQTILLPVQMTAAGVLLFYVVGSSLFAGLSTLLIVVSGNVLLVGKMRTFRVKYLQAKDERMKITVECLSNMKVIKLQSWDQLFLEKIEAFRSIERGWVARFMYTWACSIFVIWAVPVLVAIATFFTMYWVGEPLDPGRVFTAITTFSVIKEPVQMLPDNVSNVLQMFVSIDRIRAYLCVDDVDLSAVERAEKCHSDYAVDIENAVFTWDSEAEADSVAVRDLSLRVPKGACFAVCGSVGSGKSSLLYSIMGELQRLSGNAKLCGTVAYVAQTAWIQTKSVRENILFGRPMDAKRYAEAIRAAGLETDLEQMPHRDRTEIGERGINMSGGQKQRIQLARAVYADADVYLLDDPFSAVDAHTASHLFQECVRGALKEKTVVLVTHQVEFLQATDCILVMKDGTIVQSGSYDELVREGGEFGAFVSALEASLHSVNQVVDDVNAKGEDSRAETEGLISEAANLQKKNSVRSNHEEDEKKDDFIQKEEREVGGVKSSLIWAYFTRTYRGAFLFIILGLSIVAYALQVAGDSWLAGGVTSVGQLTYVEVYALLTFGGVIAVLLRSLITAFSGILTAQAFFETMLHNTMRAPMLFFDTTPLGRIISRSSSDQTSIEVDLPNSLSISIFNIVGLLGTVMVTSYVIPQLLFLVIPLAIVLSKMRLHFINCMREIQRVLRVNEAPIFLHVGETVSGITTIRAFGEQKWFAATNAEWFEGYQRSVFHVNSAVGWFAFRVQFLCASLVSVVSVLLILLPSDAMGPGMAGLALTYAMGVTAVLGGLLYNSTNAETQLISVERLNQYSNLTSEAPLIIEGQRPPAQWPDQGKIVLDDLQIRYRANAPLVLKGVSCVIESREKVGVVGRTGSGKSTLVQALFRLVEPAGGRILIDGLDITAMGLSDLRSRLSVIPQEPAVFEGSIRNNLDPFEKHTDHEIWLALEKCYLADAVRSKEQKLHATVSQGGDNWSVGERQLLCLGRALLTRAKILVLDEATASVDINTDSLIQRTIKEHFGNCTVISIAHRIPSVINSDRVLVLDAGHLKENASPENLLSNPYSLFSRLVYEYTDRTGVH